MKRSLATLLIALIVLMLSSRVVPQAPTPLGSAPSTGLHRIDPHDRRGLHELFRYTGQPLPLVSAHRGGAQPQFPENCLATFEDTLRHSFAILEIDPRTTRDGAIVVHHDPTLRRTTTGDGHVAERTLPELKSLRLKDTEGTVTPFQIPTLDEVLQWARGKTILILDQKDVPVESLVGKIEQHGAESYAMLIVYSFQRARACYDLNPRIMMEVMIPDRATFDEFDQTGVPWSNIVAFVGHTPPRDKRLLQMIHEKGALCIAGTSRNYDRDLAADRDIPVAEMEAKYRALLQSGVDLIETDRPREVGKLLYGRSLAPASKARFFHRP